MVIVASGNTGEYLGNVGPAYMTGALSVGMINTDGTRSPVSSWGPNNGLLAPGERIISLRSKESFRPKIDSIKHKEYFAQDGTSFATPMVTGTASLIIAKNPKLSPADVEAILMGTAKDIDDAGWDERAGAGVLNATAAVRAASANDFVTVVVNRIIINRQNPNDKKSPLVSIDVYGTVRGSFKDYVVGIGKGKNAGGFRKVSPVFTEPSDGKWLAHIAENEIRGSDDWVIQIAATTKDGKTKTARAYFNLNK
jgi:subtilisin family serine protease